MYLATSSGLCVLQVLFRSRVRVSESTVCGSAESVTVLKYFIPVCLSGPTRSMAAATAGMSS